MKPKEKKQTNATEKDRKNKQQSEKRPQKRKAYPQDDELGNEDTHMHKANGPYEYQPDSEDEAGEDEEEFFDE